VCSEGSVACVKCGGREEQERNVCMYCADDGVAKGASGSGEHVSIDAVVDELLFPETA
jgi:hypothetical protein